MNTSRYRRSRSTRRDPLPHSLRFIRHRPWLFGFGALRLLRGLVVQVLFLLSCLPICCLVCGVGWLGVLVCLLVLSVFINALPNALPPLRGSRRRRPQPYVPAPLAEDYNSTLATREDNAEVRPRIRLCSAISHRLRRIFVQACPKARLSPTYRSGPGYGGILTKQL